MNAPFQAAPETKEAPRAVPWQERAAVAYPLLILLGVALVIPAIRDGSTIHDSLAIYWVWADQFTPELARGNLYPRWLPLSDGGLGSPVFYFYPPLAFHVAGLFGLAGFSTYLSLIGTFATAFAASGITCWHWLRGRSNHPLLAAAFFMAAPYHLFDYTVRGAVAETLGIALIPVLAIGLRRVAERRGGVALTAVSYGAMILTHLPLALLAGIFFFGPFALLHRQRLIAFGISCVAGVALAGIYLVPALALGAHRDLAMLYRTPNLTTDYWSVFAPHWSDLNYAVAMAVCATTLVAAVSMARRREGWAIYAIAMAAIVSGLIPLIWSAPLLRDVQFPFRALPLAEFALATALARLPRDPGLAAAPVVPGLLLSLLIIRGFNLPGDDVRRLQAMHPDVYEYLPKRVMKPGATNASLDDIFAGRIPPPHVPGMIVEPRFYFPSWSCGTMEPRTQLLMHKPSCEPELVWTWAEKIGAIISAAAALLLIGISVKRRRRPKP